MSHYSGSQMKLYWDGQWHAYCHVHVTMAEWSGYGRIHEIQYVFKIFSKVFVKLEATMISNDL